MKPKTTSNKTDAMRAARERKAEVLGKNAAPAKKPEKGAKPKAAAS